MSNRAGGMGATYGKYTGPAEFIGAVCEDAAQVASEQSDAVESHPDDGLIPRAMREEMQRTLEYEATHPPKVGRYFDTGAYRDADADKPDYAGFQSSIVNRAFGEYMQRHRLQSDGQMRGSDNWKRGIPKDEYFRSFKRHAEDLFLEWEGYDSRDGIDEALGGLMFNLQGFWMELLRERDTTP
jgi:hypothetical protein